MRLPDYNATPAELLAFLEQQQSHYTEADAMYYELHTWMAVVTSDGDRGGHPFDEGDRERLFKFFKNYAAAVTRI